MSWFIQNIKNCVLVNETVLQNKLPMQKRFATHSSTSSQGHFAEHFYRVSQQRILRIVITEWKSTTL